MPLDEAELITRSFYAALRAEVEGGNRNLSGAQQDRLRSLYSVILDPGRYPDDLATAIYAGRRAHAVRAIRAQARPIVLDAGCGFGSESFLFASLGAKVFAVDSDPEKVGIARRRLPHYRELFGRNLDIVFEAADLDEWTPPEGGLGLTWLASVLAAVKDQGGFLRRVHRATRAGGEVMVTDMNLRNPLFCLGEWRRRRRGLAASRGFAAEADFLSMLLRRGRSGARYFPCGAGGVFDDVQFFTPRSLAGLLAGAGFVPGRAEFSGFAPPALCRLFRSAWLEPALGRIPIVRSFGYFYLLSGRKSV